MLLEAVLLWQMAPLAMSNPEAARPMIAAFAVATLGTGVIAWRYIFPLPAIFSGVLLAALLAAYVLT